MKFFIFAGLLTLPLFFACSSSDEDEITAEITKELKLSISNEVGPIETENIDYEFEILDGNGGYVASVSETDGDKDAIVTIEDDRVIVNILVSRGSEITITDSKNQEATVYIISTNKSLNIPGYGLILDEGQTETINIKFGAGAPYTIKKVRGNVSDALIENDKVKVTSRGLGNTYYKIKDKRGSVAKFTAKTTLQFEMDVTTNFLEFNGVNDLSATVGILWGTDWKIIGSTDKILKYVSVKSSIPQDGWSDYSVLFIHTVDEGKGTDTITLRNGEGDLAVVKVHVK